jgi:hypothetical protein
LRNIIKVFYYITLKKLKFLLFISFVKIDEIEDPIAPVQLILNKVAKNDLLLHYKIADF